jgi:hypothetical protein
MRLAKDGVEPVARAGPGDEHLGERAHVLQPDILANVRHLVADVLK